VSGNKGITAFDATLILQRAVELIEKFPVESQPAPTRRKSRSYHVTIPNMQASLSEKITLPIRVDDASGILSGEIQLAYDEKILKPLNVSKTSLASGYFLSYNVTDGYLNLAFAGNKPLSGKGALFLLECEVLKDLALTPPCFTLSKVQFNEVSQNIRISSRQIAPVKTSLLNNYPNPANPETWIPYRLACDTPVVITIYNQKGQLIRTLSLGLKQAGTYATKQQAAYWDGRNNEGEKVSSGMYFYSLHAGDFTAMRRLLILK